jgi:hypothetical protein
MEELCETLHNRSIAPQTPSFIRFLKQPDEGFVIFGVQENIFPSLATIHDMIPSAWEFYT